MSQTIAGGRPELKRASWRRLPVFLTTVLLIVASLLSFPEHFVGVAGVWLLIAIANFWLQRVAWFPLGMIMVLVAVKWPFPSTAMILFTICVTVCLVVVVCRARLANVAFSLAVIGWIVLFFSQLFDTRSSQGIDVGLSRPIVCVGDSLTDYGYPQALAERISAPVEDFGFNGYTTDDAIKLLPDIVATNPQVVVIELGGHDFKNGETRKQTRDNLIKIIKRCQEAGAIVVLCEIPRGFIQDPWYGLEREIARDFDLQLISDTMIRRLIYWSPIIPPGAWVSADHRLSKDGLHPNGAGNQMMAETVAAALAKVVESFERD